MKNNELSLLFSISKANSIMSRHLSVHGLDFSDFVILYHLDQAEEKKLRRIDLAQKLGLTASGITRMLLPLEKLHIISRDQDDQDARARYAVLTKAGQELFSEAMSMLQVRLEYFLPNKTEKSLKEFLEFLEEFSGKMLEKENRK